MNTGQIAPMALLLALMATGAVAADQTIRMSDPGWTDITATNRPAS